MNLATFLFLHDLQVDYCNLRMGTKINKNNYQLVQKAAAMSRHVKVKDGAYESRRWDVLGK